MHLAAYLQSSPPSLKPPDISCCRGNTWLVLCHLPDWGQEEYGGQQETVSFGVPNIVQCNVWTTFLISAVSAESTVLFKHMLGPEPVNPVSS